MHAINWGIRVKMPINKKTNTWDDKHKTKGWFPRLEASEITEGRVHWRSIASLLTLVRWMNMITISVRKGALCLTGVSHLFFLNSFFTKSAAYFPSDMSFLCPNIKTKLLSTERRLILAMIVQLNQKFVPGIKRGSWNPETRHSNKHLILFSVYNGLYR